MSDYPDDDQEGLPEETGQGADDPGEDQLDTSGDPWDRDEPAPEQQEPPTDRNEILGLINWIRDLEKQLLELRAIVQQGDSTGTGIQDIRFNATTKNLEIAFENPGVTWFAKISFSNPCQT